MIGKHGGRARAGQEEEAAEEGFAHRRPRLVGNGSTAGRGVNEKSGLLIVRAVGKVDPHFVLSKIGSTFSVPGQTQSTCSV